MFRFYPDEVKIKIIMNIISENIFRILPDKINLCFELCVFFLFIYFFAYLLFLLVRTYTPRDLQANALGLDACRSNCLSLGTY